MSTLGWWMVLSPMAVMILGVRVVRYRGRYRGRRRNDAGLDIFTLYPDQRLASVPICVPRHTSVEYLVDGEVLTAYEFAKLLREGRPVHYQLRKVVRP